MMEKESRQDLVLKVLREAEGPISGSKLAKHFHVSRQVIVQDVALLRARGVSIIATGKGYILEHERCIRIFHVNHTADQIEEELNAIVDCGARVENVFVEHDVYGILAAPLDCASRRDVRLFMEQINAGKSQPLTSLTKGLHSHRVSAPNEEILDEVEQVLKGLGILISKE
jgi:transcriptional regulator of NAD metabolism